MNENPSSVLVIQYSEMSSTSDSLTAAWASTGVSASSVTCDNFTVAWASTSVTASSITCDLFSAARDSFSPLIIFLFPG